MRHYLHDVTVVNLLHTRFRHKVRDQAIMSKWILQIYNSMVHCHVSLQMSLNIPNFIKVRALVTKIIRTYRSLGPQNICWN
jgi:hypothetical protein